MLQPLRITDTDLRARGVAVLSDFRPPAARPVWVRVGARACFLNARETECDGVIHFIDDRAGKAGVRITAPAFLAGTVSVVAFSGLVDADCPPDEDRDGDEYPEGGAA